jgi:HK97 family phage major capsid protein
MVRKHNYGARPAPTVAALGGRAVAEFQAWAERTYPGSTPDDVIANYARHTAPVDAPPAAQLDAFPWARTWGTFVAAIRDKDDRQGVAREMAKVRNELGERVPSEGGFLVPWTLQKQVLALMTTAIVRPRAMYLPIAGLRTSAPFLENADQSTSGQALGGLTFSLVEEGAPFPATSPEFGRTTLEVNKVGAYMTNVPNELLADAPAFTDVFLPVTIARGLAFWEDDMFIAEGNGVGQPQALLNAEAGLAVDRATSGAVVLADLVGMVKGLHPESMKTAAWLVSKSANDQLLDLYYGAVGQVWNGTELVDAQMPVAPPEWYKPGTADSGPRILGLECEVNDHQPAVGTPGDVMLYDPALYLVADRGEMTVEISSKGSGFANDTSNIRVRHRVDGRFWPQSTYTTKTDQEVSPLVILN